jgi:hypothetical protein
MRQVITASNHSCSHTHQVSESLACVAQPATGTAGRNAKRIFEVDMRADVAAPLLDWGRRAVEFSYVYAPGVAPEVVSQQLSMRWGWADELDSAHNAASGWCVSLAG